MASANKDELRALALAICKPPFEYKMGYIFDADGDTVAVLKLRGWGRISYMKKPEKVQDEVGKIIVEALTEYWSKHGISK